MRHKRASMGGSNSLMERYGALYPSAVDASAPFIGNDAGRSSPSLADGEHASAQTIVDAAHRLRTPLNAIGGFATMLRDAGQFNLNEEKSREYAEHILASADALQRSINTLIETSFRDLGNVVPTPEPLNLTGLVKAACQKSAMAASLIGIRFKHKTENDSVCAYADKEMVAQAFDSLIHACVARTGDGGEVLMRTGVDDQGRPELLIRDFGDAVSDKKLREAHAEVMDPSKGVGRILRDDADGSLGAIALAKALIEQQDGSFHLQSRNNKGLLVRINLPVSPHEV